MKRMNPVFLMLLPVLFSGYAFAAVNPADLIKVTNATTQKCVEYYTYHGELYCSLKALSTQPVDPAIHDYETQVLVFDNRPWIAAWGKKNDDMTTVEYVPMGDDINNWKELITSQYFPGLQDKTTPREFADMYIQRMKDAGYNPVVTFHKDTPDQVLFEFRIAQPASQAQDELQLVTRGKNGIYVTHYVTAKADMGKQQRDAWVQNLLKVKVKS